MNISILPKSSKNLNHLFDHYGIENQRIYDNYKPLDDQSISGLFKIQKTHIYKNLIQKRQLTESQPCKTKKETKQKSNDFFIQSAKVDKTMRKQSRKSSNSNSNKIKSQFQESRPSLIHNRICRRLFQLQSPYENHQQKFSNRQKLQSTMEGQQFRFLDQLDQYPERYATKVYIGESSQSENESSQQTHMDNLKTGKKERNSEYSNVFSHSIPITFLTCKNIPLLNAPKKPTRRIKTSKIAYQQYQPKQTEFQNKFLDAKRSYMTWNQGQHEGILNIF